MIRQLDMNDVAKETVDLLKYFEPAFVSKIPNNVMNGLEKLAQKSSIIVKIDKNKKLKEQDISEETKDFISLIYYNYMATEEEKSKLKAIWNKNEFLYQKEINEKYSVDNIFKNNKMKSSLAKSSDLPETVQKENFVKKIIKIFKKLLDIV